MIGLGLEKRRWRRGNEAVIRRYQQNRLRGVRQLRYAPDRDWSIDLVFFINGVPVAAAELKSDFTQSVQDAIGQYREDRNPKDKGELQGVAEPGEEMEDIEQRPIKGEIGDARDRERAFLSVVVEKLNELFGAEITEQNKVLFAVHSIQKLCTNDTLMAQVENNPQGAGTQGGSARRGNRGDYRGDDLARGHGQPPSFRAAGDEYIRGATLRPANDHGRQAATPHDERVVLH
jgi:hypothetical protein